VARERKGWWKSQYRHRFQLKALSHQGPAIPEVGEENTIEMGRALRDVHWINNTQPELARRWTNTGGETIRAQKLPKWGGFQYSAEEMGASWGGC